MRTLKLKRDITGDTTQMNSKISKRLCQLQLHSISMMSRRDRAEELPRVGSDLELRKKMILVLHQLSR
jgi:hypothetical protein